MVVGAGIRDLAHARGLRAGWDGPVVRQRERVAAYEQALAQLQTAGKVFGCACTRREIADSVLARDGSHRYPGTCRNGLPPGRAARPGVFALRRVRCVSRTSHRGGSARMWMRMWGTSPAACRWAFRLSTGGGGRRRRGRRDPCGARRRPHRFDLPADPPAAGAGASPTPRYLHLPVVVNSAGEALETDPARAVDELAPQTVLFEALVFLGQQPPAVLAREGIATMRSWAIDNWQRKQVPGRRTGLLSLYGTREQA